MHGVESVREVMQWFKNHNDRGQYDDIVHGYHGKFLKKFGQLCSSGIVLDLIECEPVYFQAVEVIAGNRLFNHVVSDDRFVLAEI